MAPPLAYIVSALIVFFAPAFASWKKSLPVLPQGVDWSPARPLRVHVMTFPAHGHYQLVKSLAIALSSRGHNVSMVLCEQSLSSFRKDGLPERGIGLISGGGCTAYDANRTVLLKALIEQEGSLGPQLAVLDAMSEVNRQLCDGVLVHYADPAHRPDVLVFDGDTFCALDVSTAYRLPRVARLGTGPRNAYTNPMTVPAYGSALPGGRSMTLLQRTLNTAIVLLSRWVIAPLLLPSVHARNRRASLEVAVAALAARGEVVPSPPPVRHDPLGLTAVPRATLLGAYLPSEVTYDPHVQVRRQ